MTVKDVVAWVPTEGKSPTILFPGGGFLGEGEKVSAGIFPDGCLLGVLRCGHGIEAETVGEKGHVTVSDRFLGLIIKCASTTIGRSAVDQAMWHVKDPTLPIEHSWGSLFGSGYKPDQRAKYHHLRVIRSVATGIMS